MRKKQAAAIAPYCKTTGRFLFQVRGPNQPAPGRVGFFGGKAEGNEHPVANAVREFYEETKKQIPSGSLIQLKELQLFNGYMFYTFMHEVEEEFPVEIDHESSAYMWLHPTELFEHKLLDSLVVLLEHDPILNRILTESKKV